MPPPNPGFKIPDLPGISQNHMIMVVHHRHFGHHTGFEPNGVPVLQGILLDLHSPIEETKARRSSTVIWKNPAYTGTGSRAGAPG